jgi:hypothetical protein
MKQVTTQLPSVNGVQLARAPARLLNQAARSLLHNRHRAWGHSDVERDLEDLAVALQALPLPSDEYAAASNRLAAVRRYYADGELGTMAWELKYMIRSVAKALCR